MKLLYIVPNYEHYRMRAPGIIRKIDDQITALNSAGVTTELVKAETSIGRLRVICSRLPFAKDTVNWHTIRIGSDVDAIYIRKPFYFNRDIVRWLTYVRKENPSIRVIIELPNYPYDLTYSKLHRLPLLLKDRLNRNRLSELVDRYVVFSADRSVFGVPAINIINGIDLSSYSVRKSRNKSPHDRLQILCVAAYHFWHGTDRLIMGLSNYIKSGKRPEIMIHLAGDGPDMKRIKSMVKEHDLGNSVKFYGMLNKDELDNLYDECDLAVEVLGNHRQGIRVSSSLKSREYLAKGMPFIYSGELDVFNIEPVNFCLNVPANDDPIDMDTVVKFYKETISNEGTDEIIARIRSYAEENISMKQTILPIVRYLVERK